MHSTPSTTPMPPTMLAPTGKSVDALARQHPAARVVPGHVLLAAAGPRCVQGLFELAQPVEHRGSVVDK